MPETFLPKCRFSLFPTRHLDSWLSPALNSIPSVSLYTNSLQPLSHDKCFLNTILFLTLCIWGYGPEPDLLSVSVAASCPGPISPRNFLFAQSQCITKFGQTYDTQDPINPNCWICRQISHSSLCVELHNSTCHIALLAHFLAGTIPLPGNNHNQKH